MSTKTVAANPPRRRIRPTVPAAMAASLAVELFSEKQAALARQRFVSWWARIMTEVKVVADSLTAGSMSRWDGILTDEEQLKLDHKLDHVWSLLANAMPKAIPPELAEVFANVEARDR